MNPIALLTDFGLTNHFVGSMKGAILGINPKAVCIDISHGIAPGDIEAAAFMLLACFRDFPPKTIFVAVVDPGVGGKRKPIAVKCGEYFFIGPDNGVLSLACEKAGNAPAIRIIENKRLMRIPVSSTFHGRDIFGPVAAHLSKDIAFSAIGPLTKSFVRCSLPIARPVSGGIVGTIVAIDHFGNCITTIAVSDIARLTGKDLSVKAGAKTVPLTTHYDSVKPGKALGIFGSAGFLEISVNRGNAAALLKLSRGDSVHLFSR